jgi:hypothetical protein
MGSSFWDPAGLLSDCAVVSDDNATTATAAAQKMANAVLIGATLSI